MKNKERNLNSDFDISLFLCKITRDFDAHEFIFFSFSIKDWIEWLSSDRPLKDTVDWETFKLWFKRRELIGNKPNLLSLFHNYNFHLNWNEHSAHDFSSNVCSIKFFLERQRDEKFYEAKKVFSGNFEYSLYSFRANSVKVNSLYQDTIYYLKKYNELYKIMFKIDFDEDIKNKKLNNIEKNIFLLEQRIEFLNMAINCKE